MPFTVSAHDFIQDQRAIEHRKKTVYKRILDILYQSLLDSRRANIKQQFFVFEVPFVSTDEPCYEYTECMSFIKSDLRNKGFFVKVLKPGNVLYISWHPKDIGQTKSGPKVEQSGNDIVIELDKNDIVGSARLIQELMALNPSSQNIFK